jgi:Peptidase_C39 like family
VALAAPTEYNAQKGAALRNRILSISLVCATLAIGVEAASGDPPFTPPPNRLKQSAWIPLRHQRQERNLCVPTSASIILDYFGHSVSPREIKALALNKSYAPGDGFTDFSDTLFRDLIAGLARRGYDWREKTYVNDSRGFKRGLADIERSLDDGVPVMIDTTLHDGHTFVVAGYSVPDRDIFVVDPFEAAPGVRAVGIRELQGIWNSRATGFNGRAAVFPRR